MYKTKTLLYGLVAGAILCLAHNISAQTPEPQPLNAAQVLNLLQHNDPVTWSVCYHTDLCE